MQRRGFLQLLTLSASSAAAANEATRRRGGQVNIATSQAEIDAALKAHEKDPVIKTIPEWVRRARITRTTTASQFHRARWLPERPPVSRGVLTVSFSPAASAFRTSQSAVTRTGGRPAAPQPQARSEL